MNTFRIAVLVLLCATGLLNAGQIVNGDFESGDLSGWSASASGGEYWKLDPETMFPYPDEEQPPTYPFSWTTNPDLLAASSSPGVIPGNSPAGGAYVARLSSWDSSLYSFLTAPDGSEWLFSPVGIEVKLSQGVWLNAGSKIDGWAKFGTEDYWIGQDHVQISVGDEVVWEDGPGGEAPPREGPWQHWEYVVPVNGFYEVAITARGDDQQPSWVTFDNIRVESVPDPAEPMLVFGLALLGFAGVIVRSLRARLVTG